MSPVSSGELRITALGSTFDVTVASATEAEALRRQWSRLLADPTMGPGRALDLRSLPTQLVSRALLSQLTIQSIESAAGTRLMFHAAGLADPCGAVVALVGPSGMGKTTASSYLSRRGFGYVTDETVSIGADGDVLPFPRPLSLRGPEDEVQVSPDELGLGVPPDGLRIARIVLLQRIPGFADPPTLSPVPLLDALLELIPQASALTRLPEPLQQLARLVDRCGGVLRLTYGDLEDRVVEVVRAALDAQDHETANLEPWQPFSVPPAVPARGPAGRLRQGAVADGVRCDGEALVLVDQVPIRLGEIGLTVWEAARDGLEPDDIVSVVVSAHGDHQDAASIVRTAVTQMVQAGLLVDCTDRLPVVPRAPVTAR